MSTIQISELPSREYLAQFLRKPAESPSRARGKQGVRLTSDEITRIRQLTRDGHKPNVIADIIGRSERSVRYYIRNRPKSDMRTIPYAVMRRAGRLFRAGGTVSEVARILGRTRESVKHIRRRLQGGAR